MTLSRLLFSAAFVAAPVLAPAVSAQDVVFDDFETVNGDGVPAFAFGFAGGGASSGFGPTPGRGGEGTALNIGINPGTGGGFAGVGTGVSGPGDFSVVDVSGQEYLTFYLRPTSVRESDLPLTMEIYLQEDLNGDGFNAEGGPQNEDQFRADYRVTTGDGFQYVAIPLAAFTDFNPTDGRPVGDNDGLDLTRVANVVFSFGGLQPNPDANPPQDFAISFDDIVFAGGAMMSTSAGDLPTSLAVAPSVYPNPTAGNTTRVAFELAESADVAIDVFDMLGRRVAQVFGGARAAGPVQLAVPTGDLGAGTYIVRVRTGSEVASTRLTVVR